MAPIDDDELEQKKSDVEDLENDDTVSSEEKTEARIDLLKEEVEKLESEQDDDTTDFSLTGDKDQLL